MQRVLWAGVLFLVAQAPPASGPSPTPQPTPPPPAELAGRILLKGTDGRVVPALGTVVWVVGVAPHDGARPTMTSREKRFVPHVLAVSRGYAVRFPNVDRIFHNVFSLSSGNAFDLGLYRKGASRTARFEKPGLVSVYCNIHPDMAGFIMVLDEAAFAVTGEDGRYRIGSLPAGRRTVRLWNERGGEREFTVELAAGGRRALDAELDGTRYRRVQHKNKFGRSYPPVTRDDDRY